MTSKLNSAPSNYSKCKISAKFNKVKIWTLISMGVVSRRPQGSQKISQVKTTSKMNSAPSNYSKCKISAKFNKVKIWTLISMGVVSRRPKGITKNCSGQNNLKNEFSNIKLLRVQIFSKIWQLLKITIRRGHFLTFLGSKMPPRGRTRIFWYTPLVPNHSEQLSLAPVKKSSKSDARFWRYRLKRANFKPF